MHLALLKCSYSVEPWRLGQVDDAGRFHELPHASFRTKKDGARWIVRFVEAGDWTQPVLDWPLEARARIQQLVKEFPGAIAYAATVARERAQVARGGW